MRPRVPQGPRLQTEEDVSHGVLRLLGKVSVQVGQSGSTSIRQTLKVYPSLKVLWNFDKCLVFQGIGGRTARCAVRRPLQAHQGDRLGAQRQRPRREHPPLHCADCRQADGGAAAVQAQQVGDINQLESRFELVW